MIHTEQPPSRPYPRRPLSGVLVCASCCVEWQVDLHSVPRTELCDTRIIRTLPFPLRDDATGGTRPSPVLSQGWLRHALSSVPPTVGTYIFPGGGCRVQRCETQNPPGKAHAPAHKLSMALRLGDISPVVLGKRPVVARVLVSAAGLWHTVSVPPHI